MTQMTRASAAWLTALLSVVWAGGFGYGARRFSDLGSDGGLLIGALGAGLLGIVGAGLASAGLVGRREPRLPLMGALVANASEIAGLVWFFAWSR